MSGKLTPYPCRVARPPWACITQARVAACVLSETGLTRSTEEVRRSGRSTKGQHNKNASASPGPTPKSAKQPGIGKRTKKPANSQPASEADDDGEEEVIRCICGNDNPKDKRAFIGCDACSAWQHNVCMGMPEEDDEVGEHYFCENCRPEEHGETLEALERGEKIWETRTKIWQSERKTGKGRKSKGAEEKKPTWLKRELRDDDSVENEDGDTTAAKETPDAGTKRKRIAKEEPEPEPEPSPQHTKEEPTQEKPGRANRQGKRQKSETLSRDPNTSLVDIEELPADRQKIALALSKLISEDVQARAGEGVFRIPDGQTAKSLGEYHASRIEYALHMNHGGPSSAPYGAQFRTLNANLKKNKTLIEELLARSLTADELSTMSSSDMASEELQKERAAMKAEADRQTIIDHRAEGPRYRRTHKGDEIVENEAAASSSAPVSRPVRQSIDADMAGMSPTTSHAGAASPTQGSPSMSGDADHQSKAGEEGRSSSQAFDVTSIWAKASQPPSGPRPMQVPPRRRSSVQQITHADGIKEDADVDRMLADDDDDEAYSPNDIPSDIVWRGKVVQMSGDVEPTVNARWVAGRDVSQTLPWKELLPSKLNIDGRLQIPKAEEYLCGLQWSSSSDVSVLALTPYDNADAFNQLFEYFKSRDRYAVVNKDKPALLVKDLYIIPVEAHSKLPDHVDMLEHCTIKRPVQERLLLATFVVTRAPVEAAPQDQQTTDAAPSQTQAKSPDGHLPSHVRAQSMQGPAGSPINPSGPSFPPGNNGTPQGGYAGGTPLPPNPYLPQQAHGTPPQYSMPPQQAQGQAAQQMALEILGPLASCPSAQQLLNQPAGVTRDQLLNMRKIFDEDVATRTDFGAFAARLGVH